MSDFEPEQISKHFKLIGVNFSHPASTSQKQECYYAYVGKMTNGLCFQENNRGETPIDAIAPCLRPYGMRLVADNVAWKQYQSDALKDPVFSLREGKGPTIVAEILMKQPQSALRGRDFLATLEYTMRRYEEIETTIPIIVD